MQVEWFHSFVETIHMKSLSKAGEKLNVSQTALSKQIKNLEESFGVSLCEVRFGEAILGFVAAGAGITIVPQTIAQHLSNPTLVAVPIVDFGAIRTVGLVAKSTEQMQSLRKYFRVNTPEVPA